MQQKSSLPLMGAVILLAGGLFALDLLVPLGVAVWVSYVGIVVMALWFPGRWQVYAIAAACTGLMFLGLIYSRTEIIPLWAAAVNRLLGILVLWTAAVVGLAARRTLQLEAANRRLQQEIRERERLQTQVLRNQRLESVGVLASGIAHDFNNLLTPILMSVKILKEQRPEEERQRLLTTLQASAERGADMVRQLLAFAGGTTSEGVIVQTRHILEEIESIVLHTFPKSIRIRVEKPDRLSPVHADATQLSQVLINLCINARDAMPEGGKLTLQAGNVQLGDDAGLLHPDARVGPYVRITVADTGNGVPHEVLDRVFDPFFTTKKQGQGTGLGLSTALGIVKGHGGFIHVVSEVGKGSRFTVYLPAVVSGEPPGAEQVQGECGEGKGELILVVDDELLILEAARMTLEGRGYRVVTATDGESALEAYRHHQGEIQAVLLDMMMPGMDGQATMSALEALDPRVRIIASSGLRARGRLAENLAAGRGVFLSKPYTDDQMLATLASVLHEDEGAR